MDILCAQLPALARMLPKAEQTGKAVQNSPLWQWEVGGAGRIEEALKGAGKKSQMWEGILAEMKGGLLRKHALAPDAQSLQYVTLGIWGGVYKTCHWLASTKDVASSYQKNVGFSLAEEGEWMLAKLHIESSFWLWPDRMVPKVGFDWTDFGF